MLVDAASGVEQAGGPHRDHRVIACSRELVVVATSGANHCTYCVVAHGAILRVRSKEPELADRVSSNPWQVELDRREGNRYRFAGEGVRKYAEELREEMDRRRLRYNQIDRE